MLLTSVYSAHCVTPSAQRSLSINTMSHCAMRQPLNSKCRLLLSSNGNITCVFDTFIIKTKRQGANCTNAYFPLIFFHLSLWLRNLVYESRNSLREPFGCFTGKEHSAHLWSDFALHWQRERERESSIKSRWLHCSTLSFSLYLPRA